MTTKPHLTSRPASGSRFVLHASGSGHLWNTLFQNFFFLFWGNHIECKSDLRTWNPVLTGHSTELELEQAKIFRELSLFRVGTLACT